MSMKKLLITGANGQLGRELQTILAAGHAPIGPIDGSWADCDVVATDVDELDITDTQAVMDFVSAGGFDAIVNCAAATNVDGCETNHEFAQRLNAEAPANLARAAAAIDAVLVHVSTDYVLAGDDPMPQAEDAACAPNTAYGATKLAGEQAVAELCPKYFIVRTAWLYGTEGKNFVRTMVNLGKSHDRITVVCDQHGSPTFAGDLAWEILALLNTQGYGIYHCTANGATTWDVFARRIMANAGLSCEVVPVTTEEYSQQNPTAAPRPAWSILDNKHLRDTIGDHMPSWDVALDEFMATTTL
ncbi:MAG: dTDP-4-dehydrorhamnose reductase [Atopobiaceae bacterium]|nr:dTDP-4-dehydrorhamnose reductase [Atopobiaceae bacterium]